MHTFKNYFIHLLIMNVIVDCREKSLVQLLIAYKTVFDMEHINIQIKQLDIGDIIITDKENDAELMVFERKHVSDLASSIVDGRYKEQAFRLNGSCALSNHNIVYIIEGSIGSLNSKFTKIKPAAIYSAMCSLQYFKGFSVMKTSSAEETCEYILRMADKIYREKPSPPFYTNKGDCISNNTNYVNVVKRAKKDNITPANIGTIMLAQIPGISVAVAGALLEGGNKTLLEFADECTQNPDFLSEFEANGRKLTRTAVDNIRRYLLREEELIIDMGVDE